MPLLIVFKPGLQFKSLFAVEAEREMLMQFHYYEGHFLREEKKSNWMRMLKIIKNTLLNQKLFTWRIYSQWKKSGKTLCFPRRKGTKGKRVQCLKSSSIGQKKSCPCFSALRLNYLGNLEVSLFSSWFCSSLSTPYLFIILSR